MSKPKYKDGIIYNTKYIPFGKLLVRQDGTLKVGEYCKPNDNGIATNSDSGYIVMKVINEKQALVLFK